MTRAYRATWGEQVTNRQLDILHGSLLGDGSLWKTKSPNQTTYFNTVGKVFDYISWKYSELENLCTSPMFRRDRERKETRTTAYEFRTASHPIFQGWREKWYPNGKKIVPEDIIEWFNPLVMAVWFMDDGSRVTDIKMPMKHGFKIYRGRKITFSTLSFANRDIELLFAALAKFDIYPVLDTQGAFRLSREESEKAVLLMEPFILPCFRYKIDIYSPDVRCND